MGGAQGARQTLSILIWSWFDGEHGRRRRRKDLSLFLSIFGRLYPFLSNGHFRLQAYSSLNYSTTPVHTIGTVHPFVPVSWRHYGQSAFQNVHCVRDELAVQSNAKNVQNDTKQPAYNMVSQTKWTRSSLCDCSSWRSFQLLFFWKKILSDPKRQHRKIKNKKNATTTGLFYLSVFLR